MEVFARPAFARVTGLVGSVISVALVLSGPTAFAGNFPGYPTTEEASPELIENFSSEDLEELEHASASEVTVARLAAMMDTLKTVKVRKPTLAHEAVAAAEPVEDPELFPHSGKLLPLITVQPVAPAPVVRTMPLMRPGVVQPVGVPRSSVRRSTQGQGSR